MDSTKWKYHSRIKLYRRKDNLGYAKNFIEGMLSCDQLSDYYAFSDQDDIWHEDKISKALKVLGSVDTNIPALYCARSNITDESCENILYSSPIFRRNPSF